MSIDRWMDREDMAHIYNGTLLTHKEERNDAIYRNIDGPRDGDTKWSKSGSERQVAYDITYIWNLKRSTYGTN